mmetsp:Transcript_40033/g.76552  ORF Transcript_40033/g.76552 Transcript_40033/m.76552 type:complete len:225 (+) Transcript_40033:841-1515(+)
MGLWGRGLVRLHAQLPVHLCLVRLPHHTGCYRAQVVRHLSHQVLHFQRSFYAAVIGGLQLLIPRVQRGRRGEQFRAERGLEVGVLTLRHQITPDQSQRKLIKRLGPYLRGVGRVGGIVNIRKGLGLVWFVAGAVLGGCFLEPRLQQPHARHFAPLSPLFDHTVHSDLSRGRAWLLALQEACRMHDVEPVLAQKVKLNHRGVRVGGEHAPQLLVLLRPDQLAVDA